MRWFLIALIALKAAPAVFALPGEDSVKNESLNFEVSMPESIDWDKKIPKGDVLKAHFRTDFADSDPPAFAEFQLFVHPLNKTNAKKTIEGVAKYWADSMEGALGNRRDLKQGKTTLGGQEGYFRDVKGDFGSGLGHITWHVGRMGQHLYVLWFIRTYQAMGDEDLEREIDEVKDSFKYLKIIKVVANKKVKKGEGEPAAPGGEKSKVPTIDPDSIKREKVSNSHWRFECVKPEGLQAVDPTKFDKYEKSSNVVARFERRKGQTSIKIRVYAQSAKSQRFTIKQLAERSLKSFERTYKEGKRLEPEIDNNYKFPMAKDAIKMKLVGRRTVPETYYWYIAQCKNDRQYQIQIYLTGATGEKDWEKQIKDFVKNFKPKKK